MKNLVRYGVTAPITGNIDRVQGIIFGVSIITKGEILGYEMYADDKMLDQVLAAGVAKEPLGLKSRFDHPNACSRALGTAIGRFHQFRRDGDHIRADLHLFDAAAKSPDGDLRTYILDLAAEDPQAFATSIVFKPDDPDLPDPALKGKEGQPPAEDPCWLPHARLKKLHHCDAVDEGAANVALFGRPDYLAEQAEAWAREHDGLVARILDNYFARKREKGEEVLMAEEKLEEQVVSLMREKDALTAQVQEQTAALKVAAEKQAVDLQTAHAAGRNEIVALLATRAEKCKNADFVLRNLNLADAEFETAWAAFQKVDGSPAAAFGGEAQPETATPTPAETFEQKVSAIQAEKKCTKGEATRLAVRQFPELHAAYVARAPRTKN